MPFYTFKCPSCKKEKEVLQNMNDGVPICDGVEMKRVFKSTGKPQFKGSGFYETDYKDKSK
tara:strand:- start:389 stop:571 length:183 start_codon:yes stop_codon:yes gene_type:complete